MKLSTVWRAYQRATARREAMLAYGGIYEIGPRTLLGRRINQCDRLERAVTRRIAAIEQAAGEREPYAPIPQEFYERLLP